MFNYLHTPIHERYCCTEDMQWCKKYCMFLYGTVFRVQNCTALAREITAVPAKYPTLLSSRFLRSHSRSLEENQNPFCPFTATRVPPLENCFYMTICVRKQVVLYPVQPYTAGATDSVTVVQYPYNVTLYLVCSTVGSISYWYVTVYGYLYLSF